MNNISVSTFNKDLQDGERFERYVLNKLRKKYKNAYKEEGKFKDYDINANGQTLEVKFDRASEQTGNYFVEYSFNDKPSGIATSKADYWVLGNNYNLCIIKISVLKKLAKNKDFKRKHLQGEDGTKVKGVLIPKDKLYESGYMSRVGKSYKELAQETQLDEDDMRFIDTYV